MSGTVNTEGTVTVDGHDYHGTLTIEGEAVPYTSSHLRPDPDWTHTDSWGHFHAYNRDERVPTVERKVTLASWCDECRDIHEDGRLVCVECGEEVTPGTLPPSPEIRYMPGLTSWRATIEATPEQIPTSTYGDKVSVRVGDTWGWGIVAEVSHELGVVSHATATIVGVGPLHQRATAGAST